MRVHTADRKPGELRQWLHFDAPENPVCWLLGHSPRARVMGTPKDGGVGYGEWELIDCTVCGRRHNQPHLMDHRQFDLTSREGRAAQAAAAKELAAARIANIKRLGSKEFCRGVERRGDGWAVRDVTLHHQTIWPGFKGGMRGYGFHLHVGDQWSETPFDGNIKAGRFAVYFHIGGLGGRLASWLGHGHKRDLQLETSGSTLRWRLWYDDDMGHDAYHRCDSWRHPKVWPWSAGRKKSRQWMCLRDGHLDLNPLDAFWGHRNYNYEDLGEKRHALVAVGQFPGDEYVVTFQLQRQHRARAHGPAWAKGAPETKMTAAWECRPDGIPIRNHDWKGDGVLASAVSLESWDDPEQDWLPFAVAQLVETITADRVRYRYHPPRVDA